MIITGTVIGADVAEELVWLHTRKFIEDAARDRGLELSEGLKKILDDLDDLSTARRKYRSTIVATVVNPDGSGTIENMTPISVSEAAKMLQVSRQAVQAMIVRRTLPARRDGRGQWMIEKGNVMQRMANAS